jgi:predicted MFS family arabinose efflux permease
MREAVSDKSIPTLLGRRALALNAAVGIGALGFGFLLEQVAFPTNYQLMFLTAFAFALVSQWHVSRLHAVTQPAPLPNPDAEKPKSVSPWRNRNFRSVALITGMVHLAFFALVPITPLFLVNRLGADEGFMAIYGMLELFAGALMSVLAPRLIRRFGSRAVIGLAMGGTALAALVTGLSPSLPLTLIGAALSGGSWTAVASVGLMSFFMERTPSEETTRYSTAFNQAIGLSVFIGPMIGSVLANNGGNLLTILLSPG